MVTSLHDFLPDKVRHQLFFAVPYLCVALDTTWYEIKVELYQILPLILLQYNFIRGILYN